MDIKEIEKLAEKAKNDDPNTSIILYALLGAKLMRTDGVLAGLCQDFARAQIYDIKYEKWLEDDTPVVK